MLNAIGEIDIVDDVDSNAAAIDRFVVLMLAADKLAQTHSDNTFSFKITADGAEPEDTDSQAFLHNLQAMTACHLNGWELDDLLMQAFGSGEQYPSHGILEEYISGNIYRKKMVPKAMLPSTFFVGPAG